eukprot:TRINITY_DN6428_c0_g1_i1.p1 TRINITY_DN6428_c0_g1~~TRINITY_DN6428_c0_g1_i1.p1  ORF type:complete len:304 (+),score=44.83 TRINITY_DN6428_c0_g1_i1:181-1092(+)
MAPPSQSLLNLILLISLFTSAIALPFVVFHGIGDKCKNHGVKRFTEKLSTWSGSQGLCLEIGDGALTSWTMPLLQQTEIACEKVKSMKELQDGFNIVGLSQGILIGRGVIEFCDGAPPVHNMVSLGGPHAGIASIPLCGTPIICALLDTLIQGEIYSEFVQDHLAPSGYIKIPTDIPDYLQYCTFLPKLNNELPDQRNSTYKQRFSSLKKLVLIMFDQDSVLVPRQTAWFGYYPDGNFSVVLPANETALYKEDWIGLRTLDENGRVEYVSVHGSHLEINEDCMTQHIVPYIKDEDELSTSEVA